MKIGDLVFCKIDPAVDIDPGRNPPVRGRALTESSDGIVVVETASGGDARVWFWDNLRLSGKICLSSLTICLSCPMIPVMEGI